MSPRLCLDDEGRVYRVEPESDEADGRITVLGHVEDAGRCPDGLAEAWAALAARWSEDVEDASAERALRRAEDEEAIGTLRA